MGPDTLRPGVRLETDRSGHLGPSGGPSLPPLTQQHWAGGSDAPDASAGGQMGRPPGSATVVVGRVRTWGCADRGTMRMRVGSRSEGLVGSDSTLTSSRKPVFRTAVRLTLHLWGERVR